MKRNILALKENLNVQYLEIEMKFKNVKVGEKFIDIKYSGIFIRIDEDSDGFNAVDSRSTNSGVTFTDEDEVCLYGEDDEPTPEDLADGEAELRSMSGYFLC